MAVNPELTTLPTGESFPAPFVGEHFALQRKGIELEVKDLPRAATSPGGVWKGRGNVVLSTVRAVFVADDQRGALRAFDLPLVYVRNIQFNQPILGCNNLTGEVWSVLDEGGPSGSLAPIRFKLAFKEGGVGTFVPLFHSLLRRAQGPQRAQPTVQSSRGQDPVELVSTALVDPNDPSTLYLAQPTPSAPPVAAPVYAKDYGKDEVYESM